MRLVPITCLLAVAMLSSGPASETVNSASLEEFASNNVALASAGGVATASANTATQALVNDGDIAAQGWAVLTSSSTLKVDWGSSKPVNQVTAIFANANSKTFKFQYWNGSGWVDLSTTYTNNTDITVNFPLPSAVSTVAVRLNFTSAAASVYVNELQAFSNTATNVALASAGGVATASANTATQALVNDGNTAAQGWVVATTASTIKVDWGSSKPVNQVTAIFANANSKTFKFQYWNGSGWVDLSSIYTNNTDVTVNYPLPSPVSTIAVRLNFTSAAVSVYVNELQAFADPVGTRLKVVTWNLHKNSGSGTAQGNKLAAQAADIIFTQETAGNSHATTIDTALGTGWEFRYHGTSEGVAMFYKTSRLTVVEGPELFDVGPSSWGGVRQAIRVKLSVDGKTFNAIVTHLDWPMDDDWTDANEEHVQNRNNLAAKLDLVSLSGPKIFGGDFNASYSGNSVQRTTITTLDARAVDSCFVRVTDPALDTNAEKHTYCDQHFPSRNSRLDHIYGTSDLIQVSHNVVANDSLSDHKLVVAEFEVP